MVLKLFTTFIVVAAILASPKHRAFTWSYRSTIYRVHWYGIVDFVLHVIYNETDSAYYLGIRDWECVLKNKS